MYENTLLIAYQNDPNKPCYITLVGGGVFGMNLDQIYRSIIRACILIARCGLSLDVRIVHHMRYVKELNKFGFSKKIFTGNENIPDSVWDY